MKNAMNPITFIEQNKSIIIKENNYQDPKAEKIIDTIKSYLNILTDLRNSKQLTRQTIEEIEKKADPLDLEIILLWIHRSIGSDDSFVYAYNYLTQRDNRETGLPSPLKEIDESKLFKLISDYELKPAEEKPFKLPNEKMEAIFEIYEPAFIGINYEIFIQRIGSARFVECEIDKKNVVLDLTYRLSGIMGDKWYTAITDNMNWEKSDCSGQNSKIEQKFKTRKLDELLPRPKKRKTQQ